MARRVVIALSGGVDSSVAAYLLKKEGYDVIALFMKNWHDESVLISHECPWVEDSNDALLVAEKLGIPFQTIDLSTSYRERIIEYMFDEYQKGRTPNPDILCNREIKFDLFLKTALKLGADFVATGHYCRKSYIEKGSEKIYRLLAGADPNKDQSYFLCQLDQYQLSKVLFPIGELKKNEVRKIARTLDLATADKKDSQGLCFIGKISLPKFLQQKLIPQKGDIIEIPAFSPVYQKKSVFAGIDDTQNEAVLLDCFPYSYSPDMGNIVGSHQGAYYYTIGQRKGLNLGGKKEPLFIIGTDTENNIIYTGQGENHPGLYRKGLTVALGEIHWIREDLKINPGDSLKVQARIRYRQPLEPATLFMKADRLYILFDRPQRGITPGQFVAWYAEEEVIGSGAIS